MIDKPVFYDTDCLSSFLILGECPILRQMFSKIIIPEPVHRELFNESTPPMIKNNLTFLINNGFVEINEMDIFSPVYTLYSCIEQGLRSDSDTCIGGGEAAVIALAKENEGIVASNNLFDVKEYTDKYDLPLITTSLILGKAFENNFINEKKANILWKKMLDRNFSLPDKSFSDYYNNIYKNDCNDFLKSNDIFNYK
ncbi:MAG: hypothetical protein ISP01_07380 [Methanobrevibacter arboriphilus]|uniref:Nucleic acid-binding protein n=1 Tax=Methanobrevibacter arboriphilus TaxID=39441 RepID=A0A843AH31_METAZ|nr:hypothetical protein [Methanobrevibacter arboriphilus]MBF4469213.1 hypothetical protein [Methanobrevibacter arboriphilus]